MSWSFDYWADQTEAEGEAVRETRALLRANGAKHAAAALRFRWRFSPLVERHVFERAQRLEGPPVTARSARSGGRP